MSDEIKLTELRYRGTQDVYVEQWACDPPDIGMTYRVVRDEWNDDRSVRTIFEVDRVATSGVPSVPTPEGQA